MNSSNFTKSGLIRAYQNASRLDSGKHADAKKELESVLLLPETQALKTEVEDQRIAEMSSFESYKIREAQKKIQRLDSSEAVSVDIVPKMVTELKRLMQEIQDLRKANISKNELIKAASVR